MAFVIYWGYHFHLPIGPSIYLSEHELRKVLYIKRRYIQGKGIVAQGQNVLLDEDVVKLCKCSYLRYDQPLRLLRRVIFDIVIISAWIPLMQAKMQMNQISKTNAKGKSEYRFSNVIVRDNVSKTICAGLRTNHKRVECTIWKGQHLGGLI